MSRKIFAQILLLAILAGGRSINAGIRFATNPQVQDTLTLEEDIQNAIKPLIDAIRSNKVTVEVNDKKLTFTSTESNNNKIIKEITNFIFAICGIKTIDLKKINFKNYAEKSLEQIKAMLEDLYNETGKIYEKKDAVMSKVREKVGYDDNNINSDDKKIIIRWFENKLDEHFRSLGLEKSMVYLNQLNSQGYAGKSLEEIETMLEDLYKETLSKETDEIYKQKKRVMSMVREIAELDTRNDGNAKNRNIKWFENNLNEYLAFFGEESMPYLLQLEGEINSSGIINFASFDGYKPDALPKLEDF